MIRGRYRGNQDVFQSDFQKETFYENFLKALGAEEIRSLVPGFTGRLYAIDARDISQRDIGKNMPNTPLLSAVTSLKKAAVR